MTLDRKYDEVMEHIEVTPEMRRRILENIRNADMTETKKVIRFPIWRQLAALAACLALVLLGTLMLPGLLDGNDPGVLLPGGFTAVEDAAGLEAAVGFPAEGIEHLPFSPEEIEYSYLGDMAQIAYRAGEQEALWRKAPGGGDISGDYTGYPEVREIEADGRAVTLKGEDGSYVLALWADGDYSYAVSIAPGAVLPVWLDMLAARDVS